MRKRYFFELNGLFCFFTENINFRCHSGNFRRKLSGIHSEKLWIPARTGMTSPKNIDDLCDFDTLSKSFNKLFLKIAFLALIMVVLLTACGGYEYTGTVYDPPQPIPDFTLRSAQTEAPFHLSDFHGDITLIYFGYTFCPDVCPTTVLDVKKALDLLGTGRDRVHFVFISVDPQRDTPEKLRTYLAAFDPSFIGLSDDFSKVETVMTPFGASAQKDTASETAAGYLMSHTSRVFLVGPNGNLRLSYRFQFTSEDMAADLAHLLTETSH